MSSNNSKLHKKYLREECEERKEVRDKRTPLEQLQVLKRRGVKVPEDTSLDSIGNGKYCKEVCRLVRQINE